ncbi:MAG: hypothetical protein INQ03_04120 [Candidatus Heimdallarchaeota archaeon]|nr:hypothetical protein [Candidatus Heimdallarchaeota archaeon]
MKLTLDRMCISTNKLCNKCQDAMNAGDITEIDVEFGKILMNLAKSNKFLSDLTVLKIIETEEHIFIMVKKGQLDKLLRVNAQLMEHFSLRGTRGLTYLEKTKSSKVLIENLVEPIKPVSNSTVIIPPDGTKEIKVIFKKEDKDRLKISSDEASQVTLSILGMNTHFIFN